jgi:hypothetical protein
LSWDDILALDAEFLARLDRLDSDLRLTAVAAPSLFATVIADVCLRVPALGKSGKARIDRLVEVGAFTEAALALIALELPAWQLRRLVYQDGEWFCALSQRANIPAALDDCAEASHEALPLAVLSAFLQARRLAAAKHGASASSVRPPEYGVLCCDNFA